MIYTGPFNCGKQKALPGAIAKIQSSPLPKIHLHHSTDSFTFYSALGEFRGVIGPHVATVSVQYGIDVEDDLARILPLADDESSTTPDRS